MPPGSVAPWQYTLEHTLATRSYTGCVPALEANAPKVSSAPGLASMWVASPTAAGTTWHSLHAMGVPRMCPA